MSAQGSSRAWRGGRTRARNLARAVAAVAAVAGSITGCGHTPDHGAEPAEPIAVTVHRVAMADGSAGLVVPARVRAREEVTLTASGAARLTALPYAEGGRFEAGAILARFDAPETREGLAAARAALASATTRLENARRQDVRVDSLFRTRVVSARDAELARADRAAAEAAAADARAAEARWSETAALTAPFPGVVVRHHVDAGARVADGQPVLDVRSVGPTEIEAPIPESSADAARTAHAWVQVGDRGWIPARVDRVEGMTDPTSRTRIAYLRVAGSASLDPGRYARVRFDLPGTGEDGAALVPAASIVRRGALAGVYVIHDGRATLRWVKLGRTVADSIEVLAGVRTGEDVALDPTRLTDGVPAEARR